MDDQTDDPFVVRLVQIAGAGSTLYALDERGALWRLDSFANDGTWALIRTPAEQLEDQNDANLASQLIREPRG